MSKQVPLLVTTGQKKLYHFAIDQLNEICLYGKGIHDDRFIIYYY